MKSGPRLPQLEKALAQKRRPNTAKNINKFKKIKIKKKKVQFGEKMIYGSENCHLMSIWRSDSRWAWQIYKPAAAVLLQILQHHGMVPGAGILLLKYSYWDFPGGAVVKNLPARAGDKGSSPGLGRSHMP